MTVTLIGSFIGVIAHISNFLIPTCESGVCSDFYSLLPLYFLGINYATYSVVLWGSLPYMVEARTLGTAFGICTAF